VVADTASKEKDFYWSKLRAIELLCNTPGVGDAPVSFCQSDLGVLEDPRCDAG
jgi:hypothetical protein